MAARFRLPYRVERSVRFEDERASETDGRPGPGLTCPQAVPAPAFQFNRQQLVNAVLEAALGDGLPSTQVAALAKDRKRPLVVIAAAPKSGSTYLANTLRHITGLLPFRLSSAYSTNEHDLFLPALCLANANGCISKLHIKGSYHNAALMRTFDIKPILLVRRIEDTVFSLVHDLRRKAQVPQSATGEEGYSFVWLDENTKNLSDERLLDLVIDLAVPWFVNFYVSWYRLCEQGAVDALWVTYEQMLVDTEAIVRQALAFLGFRNVGAIDPGLLQRRYATFRDGRIGQGAGTLSAKQRRRIREQFAHFPGVDFSRYGL
jgi:hypothetical protein